MGSLSPDTGSAPDGPVLVKKICLLGDLAVGKTSLVNRFVYRRFDERYLSTVGVVVSRKEVGVPVAQRLHTVQLIVWDLAGDHVFESIRRAYLGGAAGALLVADLTRPATVANLGDYGAEFRALCPGAPLLIAANKVDLPNPRVPEAAVATAAAALSAEWLLTSAKDGTMVEALFRRLAVALCEREG